MNGGRPRFGAVHRQAIIDTARGYVGRRFRHLGRDRSGVDCIGLVVCTARDLGFSKFRDETYLPIGDGTHLQATLDRWLVRRDKAELEPGDVVHFRIAEDWQHVGIVGVLYGLGPDSQRQTLIHSHQLARIRGFEGRGFVVEHGLSATWTRRLRGVWSLPGALPWPH